MYMRGCVTYHRLSATAVLHEPRMNRLDGEAPTCQNRIPINSLGEIDMQTDSTP